MAKNNREIIKRIRNVTVAGMFINIFLAVIKIFIGVVAGSQALIADGVHSTSDLATDIAVIVGSHFWMQPPDENHPYGHGRIETFINILIGFFLLSVGIGIGFNSIKSIAEVSLKIPGMSAFYAALISIVMKEILFRWTIKVGKEIKSNAVIANGWHHRSDVYSSVPVAAAVLGAKFFPQFAYLDQIAAIVVTTMIIKAAFSIIYPSIKEILELRASEEIEKNIVAYSKEFKDIDEIHKVRSRRVGGTVLVDLHLLFDPNMKVLDAHRISEDFKKAVLSRESEVTDVVIHIEPDIPSERRH